MKTTGVYLLSGLHMIMCMEADKSCGSKRSFHDHEDNDGPSTPKIPSLNPGLIPATADSLPPSDTHGNSVGTEIYSNYIAMEAESLHEGFAPNSRDCSGLTSVENSSLLSHSNPEVLNGIGNTSSVGENRYEMPEIKFDENGNIQGGYDDIERLLGENVLEDFSEQDIEEGVRLLDSLLGESENTDTSRGLAAQPSEEPNFPLGSPNLLDINNFLYFFDAPESYEAVDLNIQPATAGNSIFMEPGRESDTMPSEELRTSQLNTTMGYNNCENNSAALERSMESVLIFCQGLYAMRRKEDPSDEIPEYNSSIPLAQETLRSLTSLPGIENMEFENRQLVLWLVHKIFAALGCRAANEEDSIIRYLNMWDKHDVSKVREQLDLTSEINKKPSCITLCDASNIYGISTTCIFSLNMFKDEYVEVAKDFLKAFITLLRRLGVSQFRYTSYTKEMEAGLRSSSELYTVYKIGDSCEKDEVVMVESMQKGLQLSQNDFKEIFTASFPGVLNVKKYTISLQCLNAERLRLVKECFFPDIPGCSCNNGLTELSTKPVIVMRLNKIDQTCKNEESEIIRNIRELLTDKRFFLEFSLRYRTGCTYAAEMYHRIVADEYIRTRKTIRFYQELSLKDCLDRFERMVEKDIQRIFKVIVATAYPVELSIVMPFSKPLYEYLHSKWNLGTEVDKAVTEKLHDYIININGKEVKNHFKTSKEREEDKTFKHHTYENDLKQYLVEKEQSNDILLSINRTSLRDFLDFLFQTKDKFSNTEVSIWMDMCNVKLPRGKMMIKMNNDCRRSQYDFPYWH